MTARNRVLIVATNVDGFDKAGYRTGLWLGELTEFYDVAEAAGVAMDIASPRGGKVPIDPGSLMLSEVGAAIGLTTPVARRYRDKGFMRKLDDTMKASDAAVQAYGAIYLTGGHGVMSDFPGELAPVVSAFARSDKIVSAVCHGPAGLLDATLADGANIIAGRNVTGYSWREEKAARRDRAVPYDLEEVLRRRGANYSCAVLPFMAHVVQDGLLITGQNPKSAKGVGEAVARTLSGTPAGHTKVPSASN